MVSTWPTRIRRAGGASLAAAPEAVPTAIEALGAHTLADKVDRLRSGGDVVAIPVPAGPGQFRTRRIKVYRCGGADLAVRSFVEGGWLGFEAPLPDLVVRLAQSTEGCFLDVGANTGIYALLAVAASKRIEVHAFEPFPPVVARLRANLALNSYRNRIQVVEAAVADADGALPLYIPVDIGAVETSSSLDPTFKADIAEEIIVRVTTLDSYWSGIGRPMVSTIKIDVEGAEDRALLGANLLVDQCRPFIFFEFLSRGPQEVLEQFAEKHELVDIRLSRWEAVVGERISYHELAPNHAFVPRERLDAFLQLLMSTGLLVTRAG